MRPDDQAFVILTIGAAGVFGSIVWLADEAARRIGAWWARRQERKWRRMPERVQRLQPRSR